MPEKKRLANFELLRILAMLMVVVMHFLSQTGVLPEPGAAVGTREGIAVFLEAFCIVAVNVYVLISGYFLSASSYSFRRLLRLLSQILFYTLLIPVVLAAAGLLSPGEALDPYHIWRCLFPVESGHYWFVTAYVVMYLLVPVLNAAVRGWNRRQMKLALGGLLLFFCVGKSLSVFQFASDRFGYDFGWFICLYLIAAYWRRFGSRLLSSRRRCLLLYAGASLATALLILLCLAVYDRTGALEYYASVPFHYNFILCLLGALGLFGLFMRLRIKSDRAGKLIARVSSGTLGVYLIHEHADISGKWAGWLVGRPAEGAGSYFVQLVYCVTVVFVICTAADLLRAWLFRRLERAAGKTGAGRKLSGLLDSWDDLMNDKQP